MATINLNAYNYSPDFKNESLVNRGKNLIRDIKLKNIEGFEHFGFHELALNFSNFNVRELNNFVKLITKQKIGEILILASGKIIENFNAGFNFLFEYDLLREHKIKFSFINIDNMSQDYYGIYEKIKDKFCQRNTGIILSSFNKFNEQTLNFVKLLMNYLQLNDGYYRALERVFLISKESLEKQLEFLHIPLQNRLISPNILSNNFSFFSEINMLLLILKGANINDLVEGYSSGCVSWLSGNLEQNKAFQYAYIRYCLKNDKKSDLLIGSDERFSGILKLYSSINNMRFLGSKHICMSATFSQDIYTYGQYLIDNNRNFFTSVFSLENEKIDFRISDEINNTKDGLESYKDNRISSYSKALQKGYLNTLSNVASLPVFSIELESGSELSLGYIVGFLYWSYIYECYLNKLNPFSF
ncbi:Glucose-6-phosphate isomerase [Mycoplasmopsis caviae]|nr:Glucose-6-phosphate isomerase [Mycoplasmopsis caviae]